MGLKQLGLIVGDVQNVAQGCLDVNGGLFRVNFVDDADPFTVFGVDVDRGKQRK